MEFVEVAPPRTRSWSWLIVSFVTLLLFCLAVFVIRQYPEILIDDSCRSQHDSFAQYTPSSPAVTKYTVIACGQEFEGERQRTSAVVSELRNGSTAAQAIEVVKELYEISSPIEESAEAHIPDIKVDFIVKWTNSGTAYRLSSYKYHASIEFPECLLDLEGIDTFAGRTGIHTVKAKCEEVTVDRGELPAVPTAMVTKRSDLPETLDLKEIFTVGAWSVEVIPSEGWTLPHYPFDDLLEAVQGDAEWTNVDTDSRTTSSTLSIEAAQLAEPHSAQSTNNAMIKGTQIFFPLLNGADPGLDHEAAERIRHFLDAHPGISTCTFRGEKARGWLSVNPEEWASWSAN